MMWLLFAVLFFGALLVPAAIFDAKRRRKGLPVKGPDGLRGYSTTPTGATPSGGAIAAGGGDVGSCDGGGGGNC